MMKELGKYIMLGGALLFLIGVFVWIGGNYLKWMGNLPGDIRIKRPGFSFYMPITTMLLLSLLLSLVFWMIKKFNS
ncbi:MAG TPA: DUF2905 domain-containing protein [Edaphocola sp.]|nr:DUF2905 domain-containing protein [Edaphocola sp.]